MNKIISYDCINLLISVLIRYYPMFFDTRHTNAAYNYRKYIFWCNKKTIEDYYFYSFINSTHESIVGIFPFSLDLLVSRKMSTASVINEFYGIILTTRRNFSAY